jgi:hypothetical protein
LTDDFVVWRKSGGALFSKSRVNLQPDAGVLYGGATNTNSIALRNTTQNQFVIVRALDVYACGAGGGACAGTVLEHAGVQDVVARGTSFDFTATASDGVAVFKCESSCSSPDAGLRLALGGQVVPDLVSDDVFLYWADAQGGRVRRVARAGGQAEDVMTNLVDPRFLALDQQARIVVGTSSNGVFRGPAAGRCVAPPGPAEQVVALTVGPAGGIVANQTQLRKLRP